MFHREEAKKMAETAAAIHLALAKYNPGGGSTSKSHNPISPAAETARNLELKFTSPQVYEASKSLLSSSLSALQSSTPSSAMTSKQVKLASVEQCEATEDFTAEMLSPILQLHRVDDTLEPNLDTVPLVVTRSPRRYATQGHQTSTSETSDEEPLVETPPSLRHNAEAHQTSTPKTSDTSMYLSFEQHHEEKNHDFKVRNSHDPFKIS